MYQTGIVKDILHDKAKVKIHRTSACGDNCASCGACPAREQMITAVNTAGAKVDDEVIIYLSDNKVLKAAFLVYIIPLIMLIAGYAIGIKIFQSENMGILIGFIMLIISFVVICFIDRSLKKKMEPVITQVLKK